MKNTWRLALVVLVAIGLAACSKPQPPTLSQLAGDTAALSSFVALVDALEMDLDAATSGGQFTVFAPSNDLLDAYAVEFGFSDAADLLDGLDGLPEDLIGAIENFVLAHAVVYMPGLLTEEFLTETIADQDWLWYTWGAEDVGDDSFTEIWNARNSWVPDGLNLYFWGASGDPQVTIEAWVFEVDFVAGDVPFNNGIVHIIDGVID